MFSVLPYPFSYMKLPAVPKMQISISEVMTPLTAVFDRSKTMFTAAYEITVSTGSIHRNL